MAIANNDITNLTNQDLSIQISLNGLSFCTRNTQNNTITFIKHVPLKKTTTPLQLLDKLKHCFETFSQLKFAFKQINVVHINELATLVPKELFNETNLADYLKFNTKLLKSDFIAYDHINTNHSVNVYVPYININNYIYDKFGAFSYTHFSTILIEQLLLAETNNSDAKMYVHVGDSHFEIIVIVSGKLQFYNTFEFTTKEDFIYYILFTAEQLILNPEEFNLILLGEIVKDDELYNMVYTYVRNISFGHRKDNYNYIEKPKYNYSDFTLIHSFS